MPSQSSGQLSPCQWLPRAEMAARGQSWSVNELELSRVGHLSQTRMREQGASWRSTGHPPAQGQGGAWGTLLPLASRETCFSCSQRRARRPRLNSLLLGLELKLTLLPQWRLCSESFWELLVLCSLQENNDLEQSPENARSFHMCLLSCILNRLYWAWPMASSVGYADRPREEKPASRWDIISWINHKLLHEKKPYVTQSHPDWCSLGLASTWIKPQDG